ncbi:CU044_2847 family protein [Actinophytocola sediminis]
MNQLMRIPLEGGTDVYVELADDEPGVRRASRAGDIIDTAVESLEKSLGSISRTVSAAINELRKVELDEVELEFGMRLNAEAGVVIAKTGAEGHLRIKLVWRRPKQNTDD